MKTLLLLLFPIFCYSQNDIQYKNLALEGGGIRGIAYGGAFKVLEEQGIMQNIEKVAGSSAGAISGLMLCLGYSANEIDSILMSLSYQKFNDGKGGIIGKYKRIKKKFGIYKGDVYEKWVRKIIETKTGDPDLTFNELHELRLKSKGFKDLYCTGTNISRQRLEVFSYESSPDFSVATAVRISGGIPFYFVPIALDDQLKKINKTDTISYVNYYTDGGMLCNYPISMFDTCEQENIPLLCEKLKFNPQTLGIKLERQAQIDSFLNNSITIPPFHPQNFNQYLNAFGNLTMESFARKYPGLENEKGRSIYISHGDVNPRVKRISLHTRKLLYNNGVQGAQEFFERRKQLDKK